MTIDDVMARLDRIEELALISSKTVLVAGEAATFTGYSIGRIYRLTSDKAIPHYKRGNRLYFRKSELEEWMLNNKIGTADEIESKAESYTLRRRTNRVQTSRV